MKWRRTIHWSGGRERTAIVAPGADRKARFGRFVRWNAVMPIRFGFSLAINDRVRSPPARDRAQSEEDLSGGHLAVGGVRHAVVHALLQA